MTIDRTYPIFTVRWLAVHGLAVPTVDVSYISLNKLEISVSLYQMMD